MRKAIRKKSHASPDASPSTTPPFREDVSRDDLEKALTDIKKGLDTKSTSDLGGVVDLLAERGLDTKSTSDQVGIVDVLAERGSSLLEAISNSSEDLKSKISPEAKSYAVVGVLVELLDGLGSLHWAAAGLSLIALALKTYQDASKNKKLCLEMLTRMVDVLELLKELWEPNQKHEKKLQRITGVLILSAASCCSMLSKRWPYRMFFASTTKDDLADLRRTLEDEFQVLQLIISTITKEEVTIMKEEVTTTKEEVTIMKEEVTTTKELATTTKELATTTKEEVTIMKEEATTTKELATITQEQATKPYVQLEPKSPELAIGLDSKTDEVMGLLRFGGHDEPVRAVCLQGMGGLGKSTLGDAVHTKLQVKEMHCKVQLLMGQTDDLTKRQQEIMEKLLKSGCERIGNEDEGRELMKRKFLELKAPIFIFLDNVQSKAQVLKLLPEGDCFPLGSAILVTTRDKDVHNGLEEKHIFSKLFKMEGLPQDEARELLYTWIRKGNKIQESSFEEVRAGGCEERLLGACGGLPLALKVVGAYIGRTGPDSKRVWEEVIAKLEEGEAPSTRDEFDMYSSLMFSIQGLKPEEKRAFLDIVAFYLGEDWEDVKYYVGGDLLNILEERALVEMYKGWNDYPWFGVRVHDVLKGLGHRLIEEDTEREDRQLRITTSRQLVDVLEDSNNNPSLLSKIQGIWLHYERGEDLHHLSAAKLEQMRSLRVLGLDGKWEIDGVCKRTPKKLQHIRLWGGGWPFEGSGSASAIRLTGCDINDNFNSESLSHLKLLEITASDSLKSLAQIPNCVERLSLSWCKSLTNNANVEGVQRFSSLRYLYIHYCPLLRALPVDAPFLQSVILRYCESLEEFPDAWGQVKLYLEGCPNLRRLPIEFLIQASSESNSFSFAEFPGIRELPQSLGRLSSLQELNLEGCENLETLPEEFGFLKSLGFLNLSRCSNLKRLPNSFSKLGTLKVLYMRNCVRLETLPQDLGELHSLSVLDLSGTQIKQLPSSLGDLQCLALLDLSDCVNLEGLSTGLTQLSSLQILRMPDKLEHITKTGSVVELLLQRVLYDARGEPADLRENSIVGLVFQELERGAIRCPEGSSHFCRIAGQKLWRAGKQPQFIYVPHVSWSPDWDWDAYKGLFEFGLEDVPDDLPDEWLRAIHPLHGTALFAALQDGAYHSNSFGSSNISFALISPDKGPAHSWFDLFRLLPDVGNSSDDLFSLFTRDVADEQIKIAQLELTEANVSRNSLLVTDKTDYVVSNDGKQVQVAALEGKIVGVYFCSFPPQESFTPILKDIYHNLKDTEQQAFEVVWIPSHDCPGDEICKCCGDMPWPTLPACNARSLQKLFSSYRDPSPALVVFDGEGTLLHANAVGRCVKFGSRAYPFTDERIAGLLEEEHRFMLQSQPTLWTLLDGSGCLIARDGSKVGVNSLKGKTVGLLYLPYSLSEQKCDSLFVQKLIVKYEEIQLVSREQPFEIVAIFYGDSEEGFESSVQAMPWLALPFIDALRLTWKAKELLKVWKGESAAARDIDQNLSRWRWLRCYPLLRERECLIMFDGEGNVMTGNCGEDLLTSDGCQLLMPGQHLCISKVYGLPPTICHPSHPQHPMSINAAGWYHPICDLCRTSCDLEVSYRCVECSYDLCLGPCSQC